MQDKGATVVVVNNDDGSENINPNSVLLETNEKVVLNKRVLRKVNSQAQGKLNGKMGEITQKIHDQWSNNVGVDIFQQIRDFSKECKVLNKDQPTPYQFTKSDED